MPTRDPGSCASVAERLISDGCKWTANEGLALLCEVISLEEDDVILVALRAKVAPPGWPLDSVAHLKSMAMVVHLLRKIEERQKRDSDADYAAQMASMGR